jgi:LPXTG-site transpeptidase (sortase) family protein
MITIPKINITAPIITAQTDNADVIHGLLDSGVVLYPGSTPFGLTGQTVLLGHSAPTGWPKIKYDWVFSKISELKEGDMVVITYNYETRYYTVVSSRVVTPQEGVPESTVSGNSLMLVTCWPPGKDLKRFTVEATIIKR